MLSANTALTLCRFVKENKPNTYLLQGQHLLHYVRNKLLHICGDTTMLTTGSAMSIKGESRNGYNIMNANVYLSEGFVPSLPQTFQNVAETAIDQKCTGCGRVHLCNADILPKAYGLQCETNTLHMAYCIDIIIMYENKRVSKMNAKKAIQDCIFNGMAYTEWCRKHKKNVSDSSVPDSVPLLCVPDVSREERVHFWEKASFAAMVGASFVYLGIQFKVIDVVEVSTFEHKGWKNCFHVFQIHDDEDVEDELLCWDTLQKYIAHSTEFTPKQMVAEEDFVDYSDVAEYNRGAEDYVGDDDDDDIQPSKKRRCSFITNDDGNDGDDGDEMKERQKRNCM